MVLNRDSGLRRLKYYGIIAFALCFYAGIGCLMAADRNKSQDANSIFGKGPFVLPFSDFSGGISYAVNDVCAVDLIVAEVKSFGLEYVHISYYKRQSVTGFDYFICIFGDWPNEVKAGDGAGVNIFSPIKDFERVARLDLPKFDRKNDKLFYVDRSGSHEIDRRN